MHLPGLSRRDTRTFRSALLKPTRSTVLLGLFVLAFIVQSFVLISCLYKAPSTQQSTQQPQDALAVQQLSVITPAEAPVRPPTPLPVPPPPGTQLTYNAAASRDNMAPISPPVSLSGVLYPEFCSERVRPPASYDASRYPSLERSKLRGLEVAAMAGVTLHEAPSSCSASFSSRQQEFFNRVYLGNGTPKDGLLLCVSEDYLLDHLYTLSPNPDKLFIEVGANKGFDLVGIYTRWTNFTENLVWRTAGRKSYPGCPYWADTDTHVFPTVYAFEPMHETYASLEVLEAALPLCNLHLRREAVSGPLAPPTATFVSGNAGDESAHIAWKGEIEAGARYKNQVTVDVTTLDKFTREQGIDHVDALFIDTEGNDPKVLAGAPGLLERGAIDLLVIEYTGGMEDELGKVSLKTVIDRLEAVGYTSFYMGPNKEGESKGGSLVQLTGEGCWLPLYETRAMSNILAVRQKWELASALVLPFLVGAMESQ